MSQQRMKRCRKCRRKTMHIKDLKPNGCGGHIVLTLCTLGLWLPIAILAFGMTSCANALARWQCSQCG